MGKKEERSCKTDGTKKKNQKTEKGCASGKNLPGTDERDVR